MTTKYLLLKNLFSFIFIQLHGTTEESPLKVLFNSVEVYYKLNCVQTQNDGNSNEFQNTN